MKSTNDNFIRRLKKGKEDALEFVIDQYLPLVKGVAHKVLGPVGNQGMIDECVNDIFLSVWHNAKKFEGDGIDFRKWICAVAKFRAIDYYRKATNQKEISSDQMEMNAERSVEEQLMDKEDEKDLIRLINQLEPIDRQIFIMKFFLGYKTDAISEKLGLSRTAIDNRVYRGKKKLSEKAMKLNPGGHAL
ncbi:sigma-70 family RNA polymerase sigma factor [Sporosarcina cyprini]|uniref:sigma-70 family RNA polymerase sigma factor n=1 Tax=Sporosarcina cyprini TaxID=2910523 RepID=UPI001EDE553E|nr:sigma-70 family RNA polymerase sigma factor [Sporosarcina cyprini]MCG3086526.1 sigma-70 family RNA polymerase sigma factor [Sporosarcina cyprini]